MPRLVKGRTMRMTRRATIALLAVLPTISRMAQAAPGPHITVTKDPNCGCCGGWVDHLKADGFAVEVVETAAVNRVKAKLGVPSELASCHTAEVDGYVIEGHVPARRAWRSTGRRRRPTRWCCSAVSAAACSRASKAAVNWAICDAVFVTAF
jgi:hypothetical protein